MSELSDIDKVKYALNELYECTCFLDDLVNEIKRYDPDWYENKHDKNVVFSLMGFREHFTNRMNDVKNNVEKIAKAKGDNNESA